MSVVIVDAQGSRKPRPASLPFYRRTVPADRHRLFTYASAKTRTHIFTYALAKTRTQIFIYAFAKTRTYIFTYASVSTRTQIFYLRARQNPDANRAQP